MIINQDFRECINSDWDDALIISDPPYNQNYHYNQYSDTLEQANYEKLLIAAFKGRKAVIVHYPEESINLLPRLLDKCQEVVSWVYPSNTRKQHRLVTWWNCKPDFTKLGQAYKNPQDKRIASRIEQGKMARLYDWWEINQVKNVSKSNNPHPCPIPYELAYRLIALTSLEDDLIIDPFAGSGTIIKAAYDLKRKAIGYEIDKSYSDYANKTLGVMMC
jgi:site-specific DNA-methyltransferase (adenine-specific)